ncbi:periplasmic beta-glucosidase [Cystobacter fuscus]|uniref:Periplasmic beta-glucosidase n=1 Tax=Cystobacter fuscus TaxID=43 RepID=A0A250J5L7_9BACT|nr:glycoside hydrolase family 3 protein [Cystobacter fuscus]ATB39215.1 periplasmic beta-glucosidase [Cystobacter fuscus]
MERLFARRKTPACALVALLALTACPSKPEPTPDPDPTNPPPEQAIDKPLEPLPDWPRVQSTIPRDEELEKRIDAIVSAMTLEEKIGQMTQPEIKSITPEQVRDYHIGSVLNGGGAWPNSNKAATIQDWTSLADRYWEASMDKTANPHQIPITWGTDAVHGHNNVKGATFFPHNIGLGATRDPELIKRIGEVTAREVVSTGIDWVFGPTLAVVRDDRWGRTYEGYSEDPALVAAYGGKIVEGLQGQLGKDAKANEKVVATPKHFLGDGGTLKGKNEGITFVTEQDLLNIHGRGYVTALEAGAQTVMASFSSWKDASKGESAKPYKMHAGKYLLTDVLKNKMGFDGYVISDWNGLGQIKPDNSDSPITCTAANCPEAINAGVDMIMVPSDWKAFITNTIDSVKKGEIKQERIDDAVRRILRVKLRAGLFTKPKPSERMTTAQVGTPEHRAVAREAVRKSLVLLKNNGNTLPLARSAKILVAGESADSLRDQSGGWSLSWQGNDNTNEEFGGGTTLWGAIQKIAPNAVHSADGALADASYDVAVVVLGEIPYAEGYGDIGDNFTLEYSNIRLSNSGGAPFKGKRDLELLNSLKAKGVKKIVTVLYSGRPLYTHRELNRSDAFVAAFLPGTEGDGITDVLFKKEDGSVDFDFTGKLSYSWPKSACQTAINRLDASYEPLYPYGYGLSYAQGQEQGALEEASPAKGCGAGDLPTDTTNQPLVIFERGNQNGWVMRIGADPKWDIEVRQSTGDSTQTLQGEVIATPTGDRVGSQWAGIEATWTKAGQILMQASGERRNLQAYRNSNSSVVFDLKMSEYPTSGVTARVDTPWPQRAELDVTQAFKALPLGEWTEVALPLVCFNDENVNYQEVDTPLLLTTSGTMKLTIANIRWVPNKPGTVTCAGAPTPAALSGKK